MPTLIIPDLHHAFEKAEAIITQHTNHDVLFLGDYFDCFDDNATDTANTARWLTWSVQQPRRTHVMGNHDPYYFGPKRESCRCPGNNKTKREGALRYLTSATWEAMKVHHWLAPDILCTHAGLSRSQAHPITNHDVYLERMAAELKTACAANLDHPWLNWGTRGGTPYIAGPLWCDWKVFEPLPNIHQIMGHSPRTNVEVKRGENFTFSIMLDASLNQNPNQAIYPGSYAILDGRTLTVHVQKTIRQFKLKPL